MAYIEVKNLILNDTLINLTLFDKEIVGIYGDNQKLIRDFMLVISGINRNKKTCFYQDKDIFDNQNYFKNRLFLDFKEVYTNTLKKEFIAESFANRFGMEFNQEKFKGLIKELSLRKETTIGVAYTFTEMGNTLVNFCLVECLNIPNLIIANPIYKLDSMERIDKVVNSLVNKEKYNNVLIYLENLSSFKNRLDRLIFFTRDNKVIVANSNDTLIVIEDNINLRNVICYSQDNYVIAFNDYQKEELKRFDKLKIKYKIISLYDIDEYRGVKYEEK